LRKRGGVRRAEDQGGGFGGLKTKGRGWEGRRIRGWEGRRPRGR